MGSFIKLTKDEVRELVEEWLKKRRDRASLFRNVAILFLETKLTDFISTQIFAYEGKFRGEDAFLLAKQNKTKYFNSFTWTLCPPEAKFVENKMFDALELIVDWTVHNSFTAVHTDISIKLGELCKKHGILGEWGPNSVYRLNDQTLNAELRLDDPNLAIAELDEQGVQLLVKHWEYSQESSYDEVFESCAIVGSAGLTVNNELVSWAYGATDGAIHGLFTLENHRGKGYGKIVLKALGKMLDKKGIRAVTEVEDHNTASGKLMRNSGFDFLYTMRWIEFTPKDGDSRFKHVTVHH